jgi:2-phosphoglycerate kinase
MQKHKGKRLFITGIPTAGKSYLAEKLALAVGGIHIQTDHIRKEFKNHPEYEKWVNFYRKQDKSAYYRTTTYDEQWENFVNQSEKLWPVILERINTYKDEPRPVIFEGVNILPHLAKKDLSFSGVCLIGKSLDDVIKRNTEHGRWGDSEIEIQSEAFFFGERPHFKEEAEKYGYEVFENSEEAFDPALKILK